MTEDELVQLLSKPPLGWPEEQVRLGITAGFRCEYCGRDFLASVHDVYSWSIDHIVPGLEHADNKAAACDTCNRRLKGKWDPRTEAGNDACRAALVAAVRTRVMRKLREREARLSLERDALLRFFTPH